LHDDGSILVYDNGNRRPGTTNAGGATPVYSRAVWFEVDLAAGTVRQHWEHRDTTPAGVPLYSGFLGDADLTPGGTVLITHGANLDANQLLTGRLVEVVPGKDGRPDDIVFDLTTEHGHGEGWTMYRAEKVPSLYLDD
jgi:hypothetical protein